jgi:hypothetical protein
VPRPHAYAAETGRVVPPLLFADTSSLRGGLLILLAVAPWADDTRLFPYEAMERQQRASAENPSSSSHHD